MVKTCLVLALVAASPAHAEVWIGGDVPLAVATSAGQRGIFQPGLLPSGGVYAGNRFAAIGLRLRAGFLRDGAPPAAGREDPGTGGLVTTTLAARVRLGGAWVEAAGGGGITGRTLAPTIEIAAGWSFTGDHYELGPSARYVQVISTDAMDAFGSAELVLVGLDVRFGRKPSRRAMARPLQIAPVIAPRVEAVALAIEPDHDRVRDRDDSCISDLVGCPLPDGMEVAEDRIILDERVLFDFDRARVRTAGRRLVHAIVDMWQANPAWARITVEGHADVRGSDAYNLELSEIRARRVRELMIKLGAPVDAIEIVGHGRAHPRDSGNADSSHRRNRRVEFVIERRNP